MTPRGQVLQPRAAVSSASWEGDGDAEALVAVYPMPLRTKGRRMQQGEYPRGFHHLSPRVASTPVTQSVLWPS